VGLFCSTLVTFVILFGPLITYLPIFMGATHGSSSLIIGLVVATASPITALASIQEGWLTSHFSGKTLIRMSFVLYAVALILIPLVPNVWLLLVLTVIFGIAQSLNLPPAFSLLNEAAPDENRGVPSSPSTARSCASARPLAWCSCPPSPYRSGSPEPTLPAPPSPPRCSSWP
jgi:MFS family permease